MNGVQIFNNEEFGSIRTVTVENEPMFCLADICKSLDLSNSRKVAERLDEDERRKLELPRQGDTWFVSESGLYAVILRSDKPNAKAFRKWVTSEVLPAIRKTGSYQIPMTTEGQIKLLAQGHTELVEKIKSVDKDLQEFKQDMPLLALECQRITRAKNQKVVSLMGGKSAPAYKDNSLRGKVYSDINSQLLREFGVDTYKAIKRRQCDLAVKIIGQYDLPMALASEIEMANAQLSF